MVLVSKNLVNGTHKASTCRYKFKTPSLQTNRANEESSCNAGWKQLEKFRPKKKSKASLPALENNAEHRKGLKTANKHGICNQDEKIFETWKKFSDWNGRNFCKTRKKKSSLYMFDFRVVLIGHGMVIDTRAAHHAWLQIHDHWNLVESSMKQK